VSAGIRRGLPLVCAVTTAPPDTAHGARRDRVGIPVAVARRMPFLAQVRIPGRERLLRGHDGQPLGTLSQRACGAPGRRVAQRDSRPFPGRASESAATATIGKLPSAVAALLLPSVRPLGVSSELASAGRCLGGNGMARRRQVERSLRRRRNRPASDSADDSSRGKGLARRRQVGRSRRRQRDRSRDRGARERGHRKAIGPTHVA
jgi:hypothetical protein